MLLMGLDKGRISPHLFAVYLDDLFIELNNIKSWVLYW